MLEASASAIRYGAAGTPSQSQTKKVTGAISSTVVTLSSAADAAAVTNTRINHHPKRTAPGPFRRPDRHVLEGSGPLQNRDDQHHPEQQEDDPPIDS